MKNPWDERYGGADYYYGVEPNDFLRENSGLIARGARVLCLAEGEGRNAVYLAGLGLFPVAIDGSRAGLDKLALLARGRGVSVEAIHCDLADYEIAPDSWDAIVSIWCHVPAPLRKSLHAKAVKGLKPGGVLILEAYHPRQIGRGTGGPSDPTLMPTAADLRAELGNLEIELLRETERDVREGKGHSGPSAVVQLLARRTRA